MRTPSRRLLTLVAASALAGVFGAVAASLPAHGAVAAHGMSARADAAAQIRAGLEAAPAAGARLSTLSSTGIGSIGIGRISITAETVSVPMSVQAYPSFVDVVGFLYPGGWADETPVYGFSQLVQKAAGSSTFSAPMDIDSFGIPLGTLTLGVAAYRTFDESEVPVVKEIPVSIRSGSRTTLASARSGKNVTLTAVPSYYNANRNAWYPWGGQRISFQTQLANGSWSQFASAVTDSKGVARAVGVSATPRVWRAVTPDARIIWGSTTTAVRR